MVYDPKSVLGDVRFTPIPESVIEVTITGSNHHIGKTTVAAVISKALHDAGFKHIGIKNKDGDIGQIMLDITKPDGLRVDDTVSETKITIIDNGGFNNDVFPTGKRKE